MARIRVSYLNVAMPRPHNPDRYLELFRAVLRKRIAADIRGDFKGMLGSVRVDQGQITGELYKFFDLDLTADWFNTENQKAADDDDLAQINVPSNLKPHLQRLDYVFFPKKHRLAFVSRDRRVALSAGQAEKLFQVLFGQESIVEKFGEVAVTYEPSREQLSKILKMPRLQRLRIEITPPNPDDLAGAESKLLERLENLNARRMVVEYSAPRNEGLAVDEDAEQLAKIAQSNGKVEGEGRDANGNKQGLSTKAHPLVEETYYNDDVQPRLAALIEQATPTIDKL